MTTSPEMPSRSAMPAAAAMPSPIAGRRVLHDEVHARPTARVRLPALASHIVVLHDDTTVADEHAHLQRLCAERGQPTAAIDDPVFVSLQHGDCHLRWERHAEFSRYTITQPLDPALWGTEDPDLVARIGVDPGWLRAIPGSTVAALQVALLADAGESDDAFLAGARRWLGSETAVASVIGSGAGYARVASDFRLRADGFARFVVRGRAMSESRAGRVTARLLETETYRMMALLGLPVAKGVRAGLASLEGGLAELTRRLDDVRRDDDELLHALNALTADVESAISEHAFRFAASSAYHVIMRQRIAELRETPIEGVQTIGQFFERRVAPAMATIASTAARLAALSDRIARAGALLRTRVEIALERQNQTLLQRLTDGQRMQLRLQQTVEGLSVAAISYYAIGLVAYAAKAVAKSWPAFDVDLAVGASAPVVIGAVWWLVHRTRRHLGAP